MAKSIRGIDDDVFRKFKAQAKREDRNIGDMLTEAMLRMLDSQEKKSLNDFPAWDWGDETGELSQNYEEDLYGNTA